MLRIRRERTCSPSSSSSTRLWPSKTDLTLPWRNNSSLIQTPALMVMMMLLLPHQEHWRSLSAQHEWRLLHQRTLCEVISGWRNLPCRSVGKLRSSQQSWSCNHHLVGCDQIYTGVHLAWVNASMRAHHGVVLRALSSGQTTLSRTLFVPVTKTRRSGVMGEGSVHDDLVEIRLS